MKSVQWEPNCYMWMDRWTAMTKLTVTFHNFANSPKNYKKFIATLSYYYNFTGDVTEGSTWWNAVRTNNKLHRVQLLTVLIIYLPKSCHSTLCSCEL